jgi:hypothetical protein
MFTVDEIIDTFAGGAWLADGDSRVLFLVWPTEIMEQNTGDVATHR